MTVKKEPVLSESAPAPIGPYEQAVRVGDWLFTSGQIALDPKTGALVGEGDVVAQTKQVLSNLEAVLRAGGCTAASVVKATIYLTDMANFAAVNEVYAQAFGGAAVSPARSSVGVASLPKGALVEIECIAVRSA